MDNKLLRLIWALAFGFGLYAVGARFLTGKEIAAYNSYVPWGLWVAGYIYFVGMSAGLFLLTGAIYLLRITSLERVGKLALFLALITLIGGLVTIFMDLGRPERAWKVIFQPNFSSMMAWMIWMYSAYFILLVSALRLAARTDLIARAAKGGFIGSLAGLLVGANRDVGEAQLERDRHGLRTILMIGMPLTVAFSGGVGALFGVIGARPYWNSALMPILFLAGAVTSGAALLTAAVALFWRGVRDAQFTAMLRLLAGFTLGILIFDLLIEWADFSVHMYAAIPAHAEAFKLVIFGPFAWVFWGVHIVLGALVPLLILAPPANRNNPGLVGIASALIAVTFLAVRVNIVIPGLALPELHGLEHAYSDFRLHFDYFPNLMEWGVMSFAYSLVLLLFYLGVTNLPLLGGTYQTTEERS